jgi:putative ABC transport system ATP-binding protein
MDLLTELNHQGTTVAIVTHDANVAARTKRIVRMVDGVIVEQGQLISHANEKPLDR